jgi:hypothetical protein
MILFAVNGNPGTPQFFYPSFQAHGPMTFVTAGGEREYRRIEKDWTFGGIPVEIGTDAEMLSKVETHSTTFGAGLSPFDSFEIDLTQFPINRDNVTELTLLFQVEWRPSATPMDTKTCRAPATPTPTPTPAPTNPPKKGPTPFPSPTPDLPKD